MSLMLDSGKNDQLMLEEVAFDEEEDLYIVLNCLLTNYFLIVREKIVKEKEKRKDSALTEEKSGRNHIK